MRRHRISFAVLALCPLALAGCLQQYHEPAPPTQPATYAPVEPEPSFRQTGKASWYGPGFHGRKTASGEIFDKEAMTAAHRSLPLDSRVRVTNLETGKSVEVVVNDRGPYKKGRVIDLSERAAEELGIKEQGLATVRVETLPEDDRLPQIALD